MNLRLIEIREKDLPLVKEIYDYYIVHSTATFHTKELSVEELKDTITIAHPKYKSFLIEYDGEISGYCYFAPYKKREAYDRSAEVTIYLNPEFGGRGIGKETMIRLEQIALENDIYVLLGIITGSNVASIKLFENCGYEKCAHFKEVGEKFGQILDVVAYQKIIRE